MERHPRGPRRDYASPKTYLLLIFVQIEVLQFKLRQLKITVDST